MSNLSRRQFKDYTLEYERFPEAHLISAYHPEEGSVGSIEWNHKTGEISGVEVEEKHQRKGIATAMYRFGQDLSDKRKTVTKPQHSKARTDEGNAWAHSLGEKIPRKFRTRKTRPLHELIADLDARYNK